LTKLEANGYAEDPKRALDLADGILT